VLGIDRRAKYLLWRLEGGETLLMHLGMSGRVVLVPPDEVSRPIDAHDHLIFATDRGFQVRFNDARRFGMVDLVANAELADHKLLASLGPEPLDDSFDGPALAKRLAGKRTPIKSALLDQRVVVGVGNIYACEALRKPCGHGKPEILAALVDALESTVQQHRQQAAPHGLDLGQFGHEATHSAPGRRTQADFTSTRGRFATGTVACHWLRSLHAQ
jgi:formamidopyrimidine-DNA glycosylase